jgi:peroxiredoxin Q/BCP
LKSHDKFIEKHDLPFLLLADEEQKVCELFDVWKLKKNFGKEYMGVEEATEKVLYFKTGYSFRI